MMTIPPRTLDELLEIIPGLTRQRSINAAWLRTLLSREKKQCTWCGDQVGKGRSTWCSDECVTEFRSRCDSQYQARAAASRDQWICQLCGRDVRQAKKDYEVELAELKKAAGSLYSPAGFMAPQYVTAIENLQLKHGYARSSWYEIDHIVRVEHGGGLCTIENLRLLCGSCHLTVTHPRKLKGK